ncbi:MAG: NFACT RNA binding domain-containing protein [Spirochaetota bacterium]|nr:NFACT RNA binding domain-containing protein [Spirochaetota bacterium]
MSLNKIEVQKIVFELQQLLTNGLIEKTFEIEPSLFLFKIYNKQSYTLLISLKQHELRLHITNWRFKEKKITSSFLSYLRKHLQNGIIKSIEALNDDRIVELVIVRDNITLYLIIELFNKRENILILDSNKIILYNLNPIRDDMIINAKYTVPEQKEYTVKSCITEEHNKLYNQTIDEYYQKLIERINYENKLLKLTSAINRELKYSEKTFSNLNKQFEECSKWNEWQIKGELLKSQFHLLKCGIKDITLPNYYDPNLQEITIILDPQKDPSENVNSYFKKSKKLKSGLEHIKLKIKIAETRYKTIKLINNSFKMLKDKEDLDKFIQQYEDEPTIKNTLQDKNKKQKTKPVSRQLYSEFISSSNTKILVGKASRYNDKLTFSIAKGSDIWLHARDYPGSHVVVQLGKNEEIDQNTLFDAANLALKYSKAKDHGQGEVLYTKRKYISKRKNSPPGEVQISKFKTLTVKLDIERLKNIKERSNEQ